jgi:MFS family permease
MRESEAETRHRVLSTTPFFYGWVVVALSFLAVLTAAGIRSAPSVLIHPLEAEFGWSRTAIASAASLNLLLYGLMAPAGGWLIDRIGPRRVVLASLAAIAAGLTGTVFIRELWQLVVLWGVVLGVATGVTPSLGPSVATRWFVGRRGLAIGILTNANATGQVIFVPLIMAVIVASGWRSALMVIAVTSLLLIPAVLLWMRDNPADLGLEPYGRTSGSVSPQNAYASHEFRPVSASSMSEVFRTSNFWLLSACFFVCGVTSNGLIGTHLIPHSIERGIPQVTAAAALGIMGGASFGGLHVSGIIAVYFAVRFRVMGAVRLRRDLWSRLVRERTADHDAHRPYIRTRKSWETLRPDFCLPSVGRSACGNRRRLGAYALR